MFWDVCEVKTTDLVLSSLVGDGKNSSQKKSGACSLFCVYEEDSHTPLRCAAQYVDVARPLACHFIKFVTGVLMLFEVTDWRVFGPSQSPSCLPLILLLRHTGTKNAFSLSRRQRNDGYQPLINETLLPVKTPGCSKAEGCCVCCEDTWKCHLRWGREALIRE